MKITVKVSFPCSDEEWDKLSTIRDLSSNETVKKPNTYYSDILESKRAKKAEKLSAKEQEVSVTPEEAIKLDEQVDRIHHTGVTPMMDSGNNKSKVTLCKETILENPGLSASEIARVLINKFGGDRKVWYASVYNAGMSSPDSIKRVNGKFYPVDASN